MKQNQKDKTVIIIPYRRINALSLVLEDETDEEINYEQWDRILESSRYT